MDILATYLPMDRRQALAKGLIPEHTRGAVLLADISGFTPLTEALTTHLGPRRGLEELLGHLGAVYDDVDRRGGVTAAAWFPSAAMPSPAGSMPPNPAPMLPMPRCEGSGLRSEHAARHAALHPLADPWQTQAIDLALKAAIASGPARRFVVGDEQIQLFDALAGETIDPHGPRRGNDPPWAVVIDETTASCIPNLPEMVRWITHTDGQRFAPSGTPRMKPGDWEFRPAQAQPCPWPELSQPIPDEKMQAWLLPAVYNATRRPGRFLTELRPAATLFLRFTGIDYEHAEAAGQPGYLVERIQAILSGYEGTLLQLSIGDKGSYLYAAFGAPMAHEDDTRARPERRPADAQTAARAGLPAISANWHQPGHAARRRLRRQPAAHLRRLGRRCEPGGAG